jgi:hypothetical protein
MKQEDVPQQDIGLYQGNRKVMYALDTDGNYVTVASSGWEVEQQVTSAACDEYRRLADEVLTRARAGLASPLEYHMYARRMDVALLAEVAGLCRWRLRRHLHPQVFAKLGPRWYRRYATALGLTMQELTSLPR